MHERRDDREGRAPSPSDNAVRVLLDAFLHSRERELGDLTRPIAVGAFMGEVTTLGREGYLISIRQPPGVTQEAAGQWVDFEFHVTSTGTMLSEVSRILANDDALPEVGLADAPCSWAQIHAVITKAVELDQQWHATHQELIQRAELRGGPTVESIEAMATLLAEQEQRQTLEATVRQRLTGESCGSDDLGRELRLEIALRDDIDSVLAPEQSLPNPSCSIFWGEACERFGLTVHEFQNDGCREKIKIMLPVAPPDLLDALDDQQLIQIMKIGWAGKDWVVVSLAQGLTNPPRIGQILQSEEISFFSLVPADSISNLP